MRDKWHRTHRSGRSDANGPGHRAAFLAGRSEGLLTIGDLRDCGLSDRVVGRRVREGTLHRIFEGVYAVGHGNLSPRLRCVAAAMACGPEACAAFAPAMAMWGMLDWNRARMPEVLVEGQTTHRHPGIWVHRTVRLPLHHVRGLGRISITSPARSIADIARRWSQADVTRAVRLAQAKNLTTPEELLLVVGECGRRPGRRKVEIAVANGPAPARSALENIVLDLILENGFAPPDVNKPLLIEGQHVIPDFRWPCARLTLEADGAAWHSGVDAETRDAERERLLVAHGDRVMRVTWQQAVAGAPQVVKRLVAAGAPSIGI